MSSIVLSYGTKKRSPASSTTTSLADQPAESKDATTKKRYDVKILCALNVPPTPEAASLRVTRNLGRFAWYYVSLIWISLFISLVPCRKVSLIYFVSTTAATCVYLLLLRAYPKSVVLHKILDKRLVLSLLAIAAVVELILTEAAVHLCVTLACGAPIILLHAVLLAAEDFYVVEEGSVAGESVPLIHMKSVDVESPATV